VQKALLVQRRLCRNEPVTLPVRLRGGIAGLSMYILNEGAAQGDHADLIVALDTPSLGKVRVFARRTGTDVRLEIASENPGAAKALKQNSEALRGFLAKGGYVAEDITFQENGGL